MKHPDFLIAQISDLHVRPHGILYKGVIDSNQMLLDAIAHLHGLDRRPDVVVVSGDLVDTGSADEYIALRDLLTELTIPYYVIPGNHDLRENFRRAFADHDYLPRLGPLHYCIDELPIRIVALDSTVAGEHYGRLDDEGLAWLAKTLSDDGAGKPTLLMLHHPPFVSGIPYLDQYRYVDEKRLGDVIEQAPNVELVVCGHVHRTMIRRWAGTVAYSCPSTTTEIALQLSQDARSQSFVGPQACLLHHWNAEHGLLSHVSIIGRFPGPYPFA